MAEPDNLILRLLQEMRAETRAGIADVRSEVRSVRADVASDLMTMEERFGERLTALNGAVIEYHSTVGEHGLLYSELEERVSRLEAGVNGSTSEGH